TRIDLLQKATLDALAILPDGSSIGAWEFSTARGPDGQDWLPVVPLRTLTEDVGGKTQRDALGDVVRTLKDNLKGDPGLYPTALPACLDVRQNFDERYVNSRVLITHGETDDSTGGLSLEQLVAELQA